MGIEEKKWMFKWWEIKTPYGEQIIYEPEVFAKAFADNSYQHQIRVLIEIGNYDTFLDVGAAWGHFSIIASKHCKRVIAYEPQPMRYGFLLYNCRHLFNVDCRYEYVSCEGDIPTMGKIQEMVELRHVKAYNVPVVTLDSLDIKENEKVLIKLDVEGNELKVLKNAKNLINKPNIDWIIDIHHNQGITNEQVLSQFPNKIITVHGEDPLSSAFELVGEK